MTFKDEKNENKDEDKNSSDINSRFKNKNFFSIYCLLYSAFISNIFKFYVSI